VAYKHRLSHNADSQSCLRSCMLSSGKDFRNVSWQKKIKRRGTETALSQLQPIPAQPESVYTTGHGYKTPLCTRAPIKPGPNSAFTSLSVPFFFFFKRVTINYIVGSICIEQYICRRVRFYFLFASSFALLSWKAQSFTLFRPAELCHFLGRR